MFFNTLKKLCRRPCFFVGLGLSISRRILPPICVSGVGCSLSWAGVLGVSPPELKS